MEYKIDPETGKFVATTIRSTAQEIISLRNGRWAEKHLDKIIIGEMGNSLASFDLAKFFKALTLDNLLLEYRIYWMTHDGIILVINNYLFVLQVI